MKSNSCRRGIAGQTLLPISCLNADIGHSDIRHWLCSIVTRALRVAGVILVAALASSPTFAQTENDGTPEDWTHHHVVFSDPGTLHEASAGGSFDIWYKAVTDPRFAYQRHKRGEHQHKWNGSDQDQRNDADKQNNGGKGNDGLKNDPLGRDWSATLGGAGVAPGVFPAKWTFSTTAAPTCTDYVVFPVYKSGVSVSQPNIVGYKNLYVNATGTGACLGLTAPTILFSYYVGTGTVQTSPVLGPSVGQVAYVESVAGGSKFHVLKGAGTGPSNGTVASPVAPGTGNTASDAAVTLNGGVSVTRSSPFYSYSTDVAYVGDDSGKLHKLTPVFNGTPAEVTTGGWPVTVSTQTNKILTDPVYDGVSGRVYVGDSQGYLYSVSATGVVTQSGLLASGTGIVSSPIMDPISRSLFVFVGDNAGGTGSAVFAFSIASGNITSGSTGSTVIVGTGSATVPVYEGTFDNIYYTSPIQTQPAGNLYVCGNAGGNPTLYKIPITYSSGPVLGSPVTGPVLASSNVGCSPLTEFYNSSTSTDWLFGGVSSASCGAGTGSGGCVVSFNITSSSPTIGPWMPSTAYISTSSVVDTKGQIQTCTGGGCIIAGATSGGSTPVWTTGVGTTTDGATTNASAVGTVSANSAVGGATVTIGTLTLTASAPTNASSPILINASPGGGATITINGTIYDWHGGASGCAASPRKCVQHAANTTTDATNLLNAIKGTCFNGACAVDPTITATSAGPTVTITAIIPGTGANADVLATSSTGTIHINGGAHASTTLGSNAGGETGIPGTNGSNIAPNFQYWGGATPLSNILLATSVAAAITAPEQTAAGITLSYTAGSNSLKITAAGANGGATGNSVAIGGTLIGYAWSPTGHLAGGNNALTWTYQSASNGQTSATEATGTSGIIIDNIGTSAGEANIYFGTPSGTGATNSAVKMTQAGLQ